MFGIIGIMCVWCDKSSANGERTPEGPHRTTVANCSILNLPSCSCTSSGLWLYTYTPLVFPSPTWLRFIWDYPVPTQHLYIRSFLARYIRSVAPESPIQSPQPYCTVYLELVWCVMCSCVSSDTLLDYPQRRCSQYTWTNIPVHKPSILRASEHFSKLQLIPGSAGEANEVSTIL